MQVAQIIPVTEAEGPGKRFAIWFQGCPLRCPGCCNPEMLPFDGGTAMTPEEVCEKINNVKEEIEGITFLGGEPFAHEADALVLAKFAHQINLSVMTFSGFLLEELQNRELLKEIDILVDGPYNRELPETKRRWIGSSNQRIHFLTNRCDSNDERWLLKNTLEIRLKNNEILINGFPAKNAKSLWQRIPLALKEK